MKKRKYIYSEDIKEYSQVCGFTGNIFPAIVQETDQLFTDSFARVLWHKQSHLSERFQ